LRLGATALPGAEAALLGGLAAPYAGQDGLLGALWRTLTRVGFDFEGKRLLWNE
jgi:hypothetical protein